MRDRPDADPAAVLQGVVAVVSTGYAAVAIHVADAEPWAVLPADIDEAHAGPLHPFRNRSGPPSSKGRAVVVAAGDDERQTTRILREADSGDRRHADIVGDRPGAILLVASDEPDPITPPELDAFAMLAAPAGSRW